MSYWILQSQFFVKNTTAVTLFLARFTHSLAAATRQTNIGNGKGAASFFLDFPLSFALSNHRRCAFRQPAVASFEVLAEHISFFPSCSLNLGLFLLPPYHFACAADAYSSASFCFVFGTISF
ncbi:hypothetical protein R3P38DRAFT_619848 [Favolaschia claudopus]|uniref:Secreted protein n=1 Tax=Favolaschia claudopus TaxID=2862362 RepID=A0AAW0CBP5_9AGAR